MCAEDGHTETCCLYGEIRHALTAIPEGIYDRVCVLPAALALLVCALFMLFLMVLCAPFEIIVWIGDCFLPETKQEQPHASRP